MTAPEPTPTAEHIDAVALDLDAIEAAALADDGWWSVPAFALVAEVRRLTAEAATQREWFEAADAAADRRLDQSIAWMERAEAAEAEVRRLTESRATVAANLSASLMLADAEVVTLRAKVAAVEARVVEWESDRDVCLAWIADPAMHADEGHLDRLSRVADLLDRHARAMRAALATTGEGQ